MCVGGSRILNTEALRTLRILDIRSKRFRTRVGKNAVFDMRKSADSDCFDDKGQGREGLSKRRYEGLQRRTGFNKLYLDSFSPISEEKKRQILRAKRLG